MAGGRPRTYTKDVPAQVSKYIKECRQNNYLPTIEGLAVHLKVWRSTLYDWADPKSDVYSEQFHDIFEQLRAAQASQLLQNGLVATYNSTITKLMLTKHGYIEKQDITSGEEKLAPATILVKFLEGDEAKDNRDTK